MWVTTTNVPCGSHGFEVWSYLSTNTRYDCKRKKKIFLANKIAISARKCPHYGLNQDLVIFYKYFGNFRERKIHTIFEKNCISLNMSRPNYSFKVHISYHQISALQFTTDVGTNKRLNSHSP